MSDTSSTPRAVPAGVEPGSADAVTLDSSLAGVIGGRTAKALQRAFDMRTVGDLLAHYPRRYATRGELTRLDALLTDEHVTIVAEVRSVRERSMRSRRGTILDVVISDGDGALSLTFFNQAWRARELRVGARGVFAGKITRYRGQPQLAHPDYEMFTADHDLSDPQAAEQWARTPIPIYPATSTMSSWKVQRAIGHVLDVLGDVPDPVDERVRASEKLVGLREALNGIHRPADESQWRRARATLKFHEAYVLQVALARQRQQARSQATQARVPRADGLLARFDAALPFALTDEQSAVGEQLAHDLADTVPMNRLLQGEVGSGKTLVALRAMLAVADSGGQCALLAPTEVLAAQHLRSIVSLLGPDTAADLMPTLLTGSMGQAERKRALLSIVTGQARIVIGTHALLSDAVEFYDLGLVVVDEQHRFGVDQRDALLRKAERPPHLLVLTATPIPRTVAMTVFGDLDVSTMRHVPAGRASVETFAVPLADKPGWRDRIWERLGEELDAGHRAFVVCPAIDAAEAAETASDAESDGSDVGSGHEGSRRRASVEETTAMLAEHPTVSKHRIAALTGRMSGDEKDRVMAGFAAGTIDVLVATTVIEVGVDVPEASAMIILDADAFGVSQLHQLRGRIGRGGVPGVCLLVTHAENGTDARARVEAVAETRDGFELARIDLDLRREGDVLGARQSGGRSSLRLVRAARDGDVIEAARAAAQRTLADDARLERHPHLVAALNRRLDEAALGYLGNG